ncbi:MAG: ATP-binding protein [Acidimicrobiales bacterium]|nr:ATP-binding protein [Acidimicrobiales bacterium]
MRRWHRTFEPTLESVRDARAFVVGALPERAANREALLEVAQLVTSELASNAVLHARTAFAVEVETDGDVFVAVTDHSAAMPVVREPDPDALGGRGMFLVANASQEWGVEPRSQGKRVWCRLPLHASVGF